MEIFIIELIWLMKRNVLFPITIYFIVYQQILEFVVFMVTWKYYPIPRLFTVITSSIILMIGLYNYFVYKKYLPNTIVNLFNLFFIFFIIQLFGAIYGYSLQVIFMATRFILWPCIFLISFFAIETIHQYFIFMGIAGISALPIALRYLLKLLFNQYTIHPFSGGYNFLEASSINSNLVVIVLSLFSLVFFNIFYLRKLKPVYMIIPFFYIYLIITLNVRISWVMVLCGLILLVLKLKKKILYHCIFLLIICVVGYFLLPNDIHENLIKRLHHTYISTQGQNTSITWRFLLWKEGISKVIDISPLFGLGKSYLDVLNVEGNNPLHNFFVQAFVEYGLVGLSTLGLIILSVFFHIKSIAFREVRFIAMTLFILYLFSGLTENILMASYYNYIMWSILGASYAVFIKLNKPDK